MKYARDKWCNPFNDLEGADVGTILGTNFQNVLNEEYPDHGGEIIDYENNEVV